MDSLSMKYTCIMHNYIYTYTDVYTYMYNICIFRNNIDVDLWLCMYIYDTGTLPFPVRRHRHVFKTSLRRLQDLAHALACPECQHECVGYF